MDDSIEMRLLVHHADEIVRGEDEEIELAELVVYIEGERIVVGWAGLGRHGQPACYLDEDAVQDPRVNMLLSNVKGEFTFGLPRVSMVKGVLEAEPVQSPENHG